MSKRNIAIVVIAIVLIAGLSVLAVKSEFLQGKFFKVKGIPTAEDFMNYYSYKNKIVSVVTSKVSSVVGSKVPSKVITSKVTSPGGTSKVTSKVTSTVPSIVTSPVASAVAVQRDIASKIDISKLKELTGDILKSIAKAEYKRNPSRFILSNQEKTKIIKLYMQKSLK